MKNTNYAEINERAFDFLAERYAKKEEKPQSKLVENFSEYLINNFANPSVLEIGCGSGFMLRYFSERGFKTTAIDISSKIIRVARINSPSTYFIYSDFLSYNFKYERFSGVYANNVLHLFSSDKIRDVFDKLYYLLENNGLLYFSIPIFNEFGEEIIKRGEKDDFILEYRTRYTREEIGQILRNSRFRTVEKTVTEFEDSKRNHLSRLNVLLTK